ncbi:MAG: signal peptidase I [Acetatifactor sp.]|nr:signal peptidase I [Acetatifactor sp.]
MGKRIKNILLKLMNVVSVLIIAVSVLALLSVVMAKPGQAPNFFGYSLFRVMTGSMEPTIPTNSLIVVKRTEARELAVGDVITFYSSDPSLLGEPNTHRIIQFKEEDGRQLIFTKGDANNIEDRYPTRAEDLIGKVVFSSLFLGRLVKLISNPLVFIPLILIPLIVMLLRSLFDGISAAKKLVKEEEETAVREALAALREKKAAEAKEARENAESQEDDGEKDAEPQEDDGEKDAKPQEDDGEKDAEPQEDDGEKDAKHQEDDGEKDAEHQEDIGGGDAEPQESDEGKSLDLQENDDGKN